MGKNSLPEDFFPCRGKNSSLPRKILTTSIKQTLQNRQGFDFREIGQVKAVIIQYPPEDEHAFLPGEGV